MTEPELSVVLLACNREQLVAVQLEALARQSTGRSWELVAVDNASTDATADVLESYAERVPRFTLVRCERRLTVAGALNAGAAAARGAKLAFLNDDDEVGDGWLDATARALDEHAAVGARLEHDRLNERWLADARGRPQTDGLWRWYRSSDLYIAFGCAFALRRSVFDEIGGFDESLPLYEDADICLRVQQHGYEIGFAPDAIVHYRLRPSLVGLYRQARHYGATVHPFYAKHPDALTRSPRGAGLRGWAGTAVALLRVRDRTSLARFVWELGWRVGLVRGSVRHRTLLLSE